MQLPLFGAEECCVSVSVENIASERVIGPGELYVQAGGEERAETLASRSTDKSVGAKVTSRA